MMALTYESIATSTLGSAGTFSFTSISGAYTDLRIVLSWQVTSGTLCYIRFNSDSASNYSATYISSNGTTASGDRQLNLPYIDAGWNVAGSDQPALTLFDVFSYAGSTFKTVLARTSSERSTSGTVDAVVGQWRSTSAITSITLATTGGANFLSGSSATLYGILKA